MQVSQSTPSGRFLIEDPDASKITTTKDLVAAAGGGEIESNVHPSILNRVWIIVDMEKALDKVMHRLREKNKSDDKKDSSPDAKKKVNEVSAKKKENKSGGRKVSDKKDNKGGGNKPVNMNEESLGQLKVPYNNANTVAAAPVAAMATVGQDVGDSSISDMNCLSFGLLAEEVISNEEIVSNYLMSNSQWGDSTAAAVAAAATTSSASAAVMG